MSDENKGHVNATPERKKFLRKVMFNRCPHLPFSPGSQIEVRIKSDLLS